MLVYGDRSREVAPRVALREIRDLLAAGRAGEALIEAGALAQGLADDEFAARGCDDLTPTQGQTLAMTVAVASAAQGGDPAPAHAALRRLTGVALPTRIACRTPEGFAFYAVYPEAYAASARAHEWPEPPLVLGIRSIGVTLGAAVAAATGGELLTFRPVGHPFRRRLELSPELQARIAGHCGPIAVVDEGPGLSGSSFGCVGDLLEGMDVAPHRIIFMPSHRGMPGAEVSGRHLTRWKQATRLVRTLDDLLEDRPMSRWFERETGPALACADLSGGAWRTECDGARPPVDAPRERRKFRLRTGRGVFVARFAGLDRSGREKFERAQILHAAGFGPEPLALRRGFLLERWVEGRRLGLRADRQRLVARVGAYLRLRRERFPAPPGSGASANRLIEMGRTNAEGLCGPGVARRLAWRAADIAGQPAHLDGRLHAWEWRAAPAGICKLDALDHSCGHDLVGAQDIAWDVAGARIELDLDDEETLRLATLAGVEPGRLRAFEQLYATFQGGLWVTAEASATASEARRIRLWRRRYAMRLERLAQS